MNKKRFATIIFTAIYALSLTACKVAPTGNPAVTEETTTADTTVTEPAPEKAEMSVELSDNHISYTKNGKEVMIHDFCHIHLSKECKGRYPKIDKILEGLNDNMDKSVETIDKSLFDDDFLGGTDYIRPTYTDTSDISVTRTDDKALSFVYINNVYLGGAHGCMNFDAINLDMNGEFIDVKNIVKDEDGLKSAIKDYFKKTYDEDNIDDILYGVDEYTQLDSMIWGISGDNFIVYYGHYALGYYALGIHIAEIPMKDYEDVFNTEWVSENTKVNVTEKGTVRDETIDIDSIDLSGAIAETDMQSVEEVIQGTDYVFAVCYAGYTTNDIDSAFLNLQSRYPLISLIPKERWVETDGGEVYCIIPKDKNATVTVNELVFDDTSETFYRIDKVLYSSEKGEPILIRGNISDIFSNIQVVVTDSGNSVTYSPCLSLENGELLIADEQKNYIYNFTTAY
ncbi:MAG: hypothetical protein ACI4KH_02630 [Oscillospiraceae bacterium]